LPEQRERQGAGAEGEAVPEGETEGYEDTVVLAQAGGGGRG